MQGKPGPEGSRSRQTVPQARLWPWPWGWVPSGRFPCFLCPLVRLPLPQQIHQSKPGWQRSRLPSSWPKQIHQQGPRFQQPGRQAGRELGEPEA